MPQFVNKHAQIAERADPATKLPRQFEGVRRLRQLVLDAP